jgi:predicted secreted Zn-dependent protease
LKFSLLGTVITAIGFDSWKRNFNKKDIICQLVIDRQKLVVTGLLPKNDDLIHEIETASKACRIHLGLVELAL